MLAARSHAAQANITRGCAERFDPAHDYFPDKAAVEDAANFAIEYHQSYKLLGITDPSAGRVSERYALVQCGAPSPQLRGEWTRATVIHVPVTSVFAGSPTQIPVFVDLDRLEVITGVPRVWDLADDALGNGVQRGRAKEFSPASVIDTELVVAARPSLLLTGGTANPALSVIRSAGVPVVSDVAWLESTALARAEWLKFVALFLNEERTSQRLYAAMKGRYRRLSERASADQSSRPLVMTGRSNRGHFVIAGGRSYVAALIQDAGGRYVWPDNTAAGSATVDFETQVQRAANADIWINGGGWPNLAAMLEEEPRYAAFKAFRNKQVWVYERRLTPRGSNDYWSRSVTHPDLVLADLVKIFHPALLPSHTFEWYMPVLEK
jgi:iron complex transport system substrate-binding protein